MEVIDTHWAPFYTMHKALAGLRDARRWAQGRNPGENQAKRTCLLRSSNGTLARCH